MSLRHNPMNKRRFDGYREDTSSIHEVVEVASRFTKKVRAIPVKYAILVLIDDCMYPVKHTPKILNGHLLQTSDGLKIRPLSLDSVNFNIRSRLFVYANREGRYNISFANGDYFCWKWWFADEPPPKMSKVIRI